MGKWCCGVANEREEVFSEAAESPQPAGAADTRQQRSSSAPPARSQVIIAEDPTASPGGSARLSASLLRYTPQHGIQRDFTNRRDRTKLKAASRADTWSHRMPQPCRRVGVPASCAPYVPEAQDCSC